MENSLANRHISFVEINAFLHHHQKLEGPTVYTNPRYMSLQFSGWELVLTVDGNYFINDTSGG